MPIVLVKIRFLHMYFRFSKTWSIPTQLQCTLYAMAKKSWTVINGI